MVIPKATSEAHVRENRAALDIALSRSRPRRVDPRLPAAPRREPLEML